MSDMRTELDRAIRRQQQAPRDLGEAAVSDLSKYRDDLAETVDRAYYEGHGGMSTVSADVTAALLASSVVARMIADAKAEERERVAHEVALLIEQTPAEEWRESLDVGDTAEQGYYNGANSAIWFAARTARGGAR